LLETLWIGAAVTAQAVVSIFHQFGHTALVNASSQDNVSHQLLLDVERETARCSCTTTKNSCFSFECVD